MSLSRKISLVLILLSVLCLKNIQANPIPDSLRSFSPPLLTEIDRGEISDEIELKFAFNAERYKFSHDLLFSPIKDSNGYIYLERAEGINHHGRDISIFDGSKIIGINPYDSTMSESPRSWSSLEHLFKDYFYSRLLLLPKSERVRTTTHKLRDTLVDNIPYRYFVKRKLSPDSKLDDTTVRNSDGSAQNGLYEQYYYIDKNSNALVRQEEYYFFSNDTQISIYALNYIRPLKSEAKLRKMFEDTIKKHITFCKYKSNDAINEKKKIDPNSFVGKIIPPLKLTTLDDKPMTVADLPNSYILLDCSYNSCYPCHLSIPMLKRIQKEYKDKGLSVICANTQDNINSIEAGIRRDSLSYPVYRMAKDEIWNMGIMGAPAFILLDKKKKIHYISIGYGEGFYNVLSKEIDTMIATKE